MILTCPACDTSYFVPDEAIGPTGRRVRCKSCGHDWRASLEDEPLELTPAADMVAEPLSEKPVDVVSDPFTETTAPELPKAYRAKVEQRRRMRRAATLGATWVGLIVALVALVMTAIAFRLPVVKVWPQTASFYKAIGFPVNLTGVEVEALRGKTLLHAPDRVVVGGALRNIRDLEVVPPTLIIILRDERGTEVVRQRLPIDGPPILPGKVQGFAAVVPNPEGKASGISIDFAMATQADTVSDKTPEKTVPKPRPLPTADDGRRPASTRTEAPIDSAPLDKKGH